MYKKNYSFLWVFDVANHFQERERKLLVRGGVIKVTKGVLVVMKREKAFKNLYKLIGETVKGGA